MSAEYKNIPLNNYKQRKLFWKNIEVSTPQKTLLDNLKKLPPSCAEVLTLHYYKQQSFAAIAKQLNRSVTTIRNRHDLGIFLLAKQLFS